MTARYSHLQLSNMPEITEKLLIPKQIFINNSLNIKEAKNYG
jgi:hypothetical protein